MRAKPLSSRLRVLIAIASFGEKNLRYLRDVIAHYQAMPIDTKIVVLAEADKSVDLGVDVIVGLPSSNPFSLPFAHLRLFSENIDKFDIYIYTEDDIRLPDDAIRRFCEASSRVADDEVPGFLRYEVAPDGTKSLPDVHGRFHWVPASARRRDGLVTAEFTNQHAGMYMLTSAQLQRAVRSGAYVCSPYEGPYEMLESAATHVYANCGLRKVICISELDDFLVHHMPNRYAGTLGAPLSVVRRQVDTLVSIADGTHPASILCPVVSWVLEREWSKRYDESASPDILVRLPPRPGSALSIGAGSGKLEYELLDRGARVTALPLDSVVGASLEEQGLRVLYGTLAEGLAACGGQSFDCVLVANLLHLQPDAPIVVRACADLLAPGGALIVSGPTINRFVLVTKGGLVKGLRSGATRLRPTTTRACSARSVAKEMRSAGLRVVSVGHTTHANRLAPFVPQALSSKSWVISAEKPRTDGPA